MLAVSLILTSCDKGRIEEFSGSEDRSQSIAENYLIVLASRLVPDYLISLESALSYDEYEYYKTSVGQSSYETGGQSIRTQGVTWIVSAKKKVDGLKITCKGDGLWELYREGPYTYNDYYENEAEVQYVTVCAMTAEMLEDLGHGHFNWKVTFNGSRTEREGYSCIFQSTPTLTYQDEQSRTYTWNHCYGSATMLIDRNGEKIDMARMDFDGNGTRFFRGL